MQYAVLKNGGALPLASLKAIPFEEFRKQAKEAILQEDCRVSAFFVLPAERKLCLLLLDPQAHHLRVLTTAVGKSYPSLTPELPALHWFEREIFEIDKILPEGHPWLKPIRFTGNGAEAAVTDYFTMQGEAAHEVAVGPVHAGVIEPGHFRFQCMGEDVYHLEISLGFQHRGIEKMLEGDVTSRTLPLLECAAGDSSIASALCGCRNREVLCGKTVSPRGFVLRGLALELERIANHIGDLGALAGDVAFLPTASFCGRIRGDFLNMTASLCGNRFGRGLIVPGGVRYDLNGMSAATLLKKVETGEKELFHALDLMFDEPSVLDRLENTGAVSFELAREIGLVGVAARASGLARDSRLDLAEPQCGSVRSSLCKGKEGDVFSRALVRRLELKNSIDIVKSILSHPLPKGNCAAAVSGAMVSDTLAVSVTEAWRGELVHAAVTDSEGKIARYKIVDPSFHNWFGLAMALRNQQVSDFPICNKSFNLSYCGHDL